ncbi:MAG TPA: hypothetical protein PLW35_03280 [Verrucomicrobiota bacterium]|nr:hypothetical protein [Verrucomicrobiota bacterium]
MKSLQLGMTIWFCLGCLSAQTATIELNLLPLTNGFSMAWGANIGPIASGEPTNPPVTSGYRNIGVRLIRTHDYYGPLDMRAMYPNQDADPAVPTSYDFTASDKVWLAIVTNGFYPYFRLGNSYTNSGPYAPSNEANWAEAGVHVIRRYSDPTLWGTNALRYVEIWNEPDNATFWEQGPDARMKFFAFFATVALRLRAEFPDLKIGGPGVTHAAFLKPGVTNYIPEFLSYLRSRNLPLDFLSWHLYSNDPFDYVRGARFYRSCLDSAGYTNTEQHVTEYNTDNRTDDGVGIRAWLPGAAINTAAWMAMQQENIALATVYRGPDPSIDAPFFYGIFYADGQPKATALAAKLCNALARCSNRLDVVSNDTNLWVMAGRTGNSVTMLLSNPTTNTITWTLALSDGREQKNRTLIEIVPASTNAHRRDVIYWSFTTNTMDGPSQTIGPWGVQMVTFDVLSDYDHWAQTVHGLSGVDAEPDADADSDGQSNWNEFVSGTDPTDAASRFRIEVLHVVSGNLVMEWTAVPGRTYRVQTTSSFGTTDTWVDISPDLSNGFFVHSNITSQTQFYRLLVLQP